MFYITYVAPWCSGYHYHSTKLELKFCAGPNPTCDVLEICHGEYLQGSFISELVKHPLNILGISDSVPG